MLPRCPVKAWGTRSPGWRGRLRKLKVVAASEIFSGLWISLCSNFYQHGLKRSN